MRQRKTLFEVSKRANTIKADIIGRFEIMPATCCAKVQFLSATKIKTTSQGLPIKQDINTVQGAHPTKTAAAPSLAFWPGKFCQNGRNDIAKQ